jgi:hypothetical protein
MNEKKSLLPWLQENRGKLERLLDSDRPGLQEAVDRLKERVLNINRSDSNTHSAVLDVSRKLDDTCKTLSNVWLQAQTQQEQIRKICRHKYVIRAVARPHEPGIVHILKVCAICGAEKKFGWFRRIILLVTGVFSCVK